MEQQQPINQQRRIQSIQNHIHKSYNITPNSKNTILFHPSQTLVQKEYDYIIIGAGSSGCALAARLAEKAPNKSVLLVDAGRNNQQFRVQSPFITCPNLQNSDLDFAFRTTKQTLQQNRQSYWPRGKVLGGCSSINFMLAVRGDARGYDKWANELGCSGWSFKDVEKYFMRLENYRGTNPIHFENRGKHGPIVITDNRNIDFVTKGVCEAFVKGCEEIGIQPTSDYNIPYQFSSAGLSQNTIEDGKRCDTASAYLFGEHGAFKTCPNLSCLTNEHCCQIIFDSNAALPRAIGVEFISGLKIKARNEIILSAGAVGSPQILLLSGIGPKSHLMEKQIPVIVDLPGVGQNLKDHLFLSYAFKFKSTNLSRFSPNSIGDIAHGLIRLFIFNDGLFTTSWVQAMAFMDSQKYQKPTDAHAIQIHVVPLISSDEEQTKRNFGFDRSIHEMSTKLEITPPGLMFLPSLLQPKSVGFIELATNNPKDHPIIEPNYLSHPDDIGVLLEAWKFCNKVANSNSMKPIIEGPLIDDSVKFPIDSDEYAIYKIKRDVVTIYHPTSTCKMGPDSDPMSVLDPKTLGVRKVTNLRVCDCSSFPDIPAANTNLPAIMLAERCADLIVFGGIV